jgi:hypothetical protein
MDAVLSVAGGAEVKKLEKSLPTLKALAGVPDKVLLPMLPDIIYGLTYTQKKNIENMLLLGCRYFEWRPARLYTTFKELSGLPDKASPRSSKFPQLC